MAGLLFPRGAGEGDDEERHRVNLSPHKGRNACTNCGFCQGYPCHVGAKVSTNEIVRDTAEETGNLEIRPFSRVIRVNKGADGRVKGVSYIEYDERVADAAPSNFS